MHIKFSCEDRHFGAFPQPTPAAKQMPKFFKDLKPQANDDVKTGTAKRCMPMVDAFSAGFIIPMWSDVRVIAHGDTLDIHFPEGSMLSEGVLAHKTEQLPKHPFSDTPLGQLLLRWINPWLIETEPGYSCLFTSPLNHMETRFKILDGVVDTDMYYNNVNFPFIWTAPDGEYLIKRGTPFVQVIPFKREDHTLELGVIDETSRARVTSTLGSYHSHAYRSEFHHNKKEPVDDE